MRAFEPDELVKVSITKVPRPKVPVHERSHDGGRAASKGFAFLATAIALICVMILVLAMIAGTRP
jgi:hypothetical protein